MKNKTIGFVVILFFVWLFAKNDKVPAADSSVQNSNTSTSSSLSAAQQIPDITGSEQPVHRYGCNGVADHQLTVRRRSIDF
ncbi:hypothetical protein [Kluyvera sichuanensis]